MKRLTLLLSLLALYGCDSKTDTDASTPDKATIKQEINDNVKDVINKRAPKWVIDYSGDMQGTIQGFILTLVSVSSVTKVGGASMTEDMTAKATESFMLTIMNIHTPPTATMALTLADGTRCVDAKTSTVKIIDEDSKTFKAEATGALRCGDRHIDYTAKLDKKP